MTAPRSKAANEARTFDRLPKLDHGIYLVTTLSGTVHRFETSTWRPTWQRFPVDDSPSPPIPIRELDGNWKVGNRGYVELSDGSYLHGNTWRLSATIASITLDDRCCSRCHHEERFRGFCPMCFVQPSWSDTPEHWNFGNDDGTRRGRVRAWLGHAQSRLVEHRRKRLLFRLAKQR